MQRAYRRGGGTGETPGRHGRRVLLTTPLADGVAAARPPHIAWFGELHWPELREPLGFDRDRAPRATTISRALAGAPFAQLQEALLDWMMGVVSDRELSGAVDGKWGQQSQDAAG